MNNDVTEHYVNHLQQAKLPGHDLVWLQQHRKQNIEIFSKHGFPTLQDEDWKYTNLNSIATKAFTTTTINSINADILQSYLIDGLNSHRAVFVNGTYIGSLSDRVPVDSGYTLTSLADAIRQRPEVVKAFLDQSQSSDGFTALNNAWSADGMVIELRPNRTIDKPIELIFISSGDHTLSQPRNLLIAGEGAKAEIIERYVSYGEDSTLTNAHTQISIAKGAEINYYSLPQENHTSCFIGNLKVHQSQDSQFKCYTLSLGGQLVRNTLQVTLEQSGANCDMLGLYSVNGRQHVDNHTNVWHAAAECSSRELYKGVLDQRSRAVFHGRIRVEPGAQKTDAMQSNNNLLLSSNAEIDTKPQLEIYADDVQCSHGATVGQLDPDALFYLRSRALDPQAAQALLIFAFLNDVLIEINQPALRSYLEAILKDKYIIKQK